MQFNVDDTKSQCYNLAHKSVEALKFYSLKFDKV